MPSGTWRVEVLLPSRLGLIDLDQIAELFELGAPEAKAVATLRKWYNEACSRVARRDYGSLLSELRKFSDIDEDSYDLLSEKERKRALKLAYLVGEYPLDYERLTDSYFSLFALWVLGKNLNRGEILDFLAGQSWGMKHEVLVRWGWMQRHRELLAQQHDLPHPFLCTVAGRHKPGRTADREFYQLVRFLHALRDTTGQELLFLNKGETPDFVLEGSAGELIGAEMSEVPLSKSWAEEQNSQVKVLGYLKPHFEEKSLSIHIHEPKSWKSLVGQLPVLEAWFSSVIARITGATRSLEAWNEDLGLRMEIKASRESSIVISSSSGGAEVQEEIRLMADAIYDRLRAKICNVGEAEVVKLRKHPSVRPCHLVLYPNHGVDLDIEAAVEIFLARLDFDLSTHFDSVWLSTENMIHKVWPVE